MLTESVDKRGIAVTAFSPDGPLHYLGLWAKLDAPRGQHPDAKCGRSRRAFCRDDVCGKVKCCPITARSSCLGAHCL